LLAVIAAWTVSTVLALAFQCPLPTPWRLNKDTCIDQRALYLVSGLLNISTDLALVVMPWIMIRWVQTNASRKWQVMSLFGCRIIVPMFIIPQLVTLQNYHLDDPTWTAVAPTIWTQLVLNLSILTACIPSLKAALDMFRSGTSLFTVPAQYDSHIETSSNGLRSRLAEAISSRFALTSRRRSGSRGRSQVNTTTTSLSSGNEWPPKQMRAVSGQHTVEVSSAGRHQQSKMKGIPERSESQKSLTETGILRTVDYEVEYEDMRKLPKVHRGSDQQSSLDSLENEEQHVHAMGK